MKPQHRHIRTTNTTTKDANDESLRKWKASLGIGSGTPLKVDASDKRRVVMLSLGLEVKGRPDIVIDLSQPGAIENLKSKPFTIKEGAEFRMKVKFRVQHQVLSGMKYLQVVKKMGLSSKVQEMIGSYAPSTEETPVYEKKCKLFLIHMTLHNMLRGTCRKTEKADVKYAIVAEETAPSGMLGRGHYNAVSKFVDDDNVTHLEFSWSFDIKKDWE